MVVKTRHYIKNRKKEKVRAFLSKDQSRFLNINYKQKKIIVCQKKSKKSRPICTTIRYYHKKKNVHSWHIIRHKSLACNGFIEGKRKGGIQKRKRMNDMTTCRYLKKNIRNGEIFYYPCHAIHIRCQHHGIE